MDIRIQPVIVIYNMKCSESKTVMELIRQDTKPLIVDNSTSDYGNSEFCEKRGMAYIDMKGNAGITKAYNAALSKMPDDADYILWLDDDTLLPDNYIQHVMRAVLSDKKHSVYLPLVKSGDSYLSPCIAKKERMIRVRDAESLVGQEISAINSGMLVKKEVYKNYTYDEGLFLDCVDHDFMHFVKERNIPVSVLSDIVLIQNFSGDETGSIRRKLNRNRIYSKDFKHYMKKHGASRAEIELRLAKRTVSIFLKGLLKKQQ